MQGAEHKKHPDLMKPSKGNFGRNEWAVLGTTCQAVKQLAEQIITKLSATYHCAYVDASHAGEGQPALLPGRLAAGAIAEYTDRINCQEIVFSSTWNACRFNHMLNDADLILVNGNHHQAKSQIVVIDQEKEASLKKRIHLLTDVQLFLLSRGMSTVFDFVKDAIPHWDQVPVFGLYEQEKIVSFLKMKMESSVPELNGLVLAGGMSLRFGSDKGKINWHGKDQRAYVAELLQPHCAGVFISCRESQQQELSGSIPLLTDTFTGLGPFGAILSAFRKKPDAAWLVVACDLPLIDQGILRFLVSHRNQAAIATAFKSPHDGLPEPLITIWEPKSYSVMLSFLAQGHSCPRKVLMNSEVTIIQPPFPEALINVNTQEEFKVAKAMLGD